MIGHVVDTPLDSLPSDVVLSPALGVQRGMWLAHVLDPQSPAYHISLVTRIRGDLDIAALERAVAGLARHEAFRSAFVQSDRRLYQVTWPGRGPVLERRDDPDLGEAELIREAFDRPFDVATPPLVRIVLSRRGPGEHLLILVAHHLVADASTVQIMWDEVSDAYNGVALPARDDRPYAGYLAAAVEWLESPRYKDALELFRTRLSGFPPALAWPPVASSSAQPWSGAMETRVLSRETTASLIALAQRLHVTPFVLMLTVFAAVLHRTTGQDRIAVGTPVSLRDEPGLGRVAGMLLNSVALPTVWPDDPSFTFTDAVRATDDTVLDCLDFRRCPFDQLVADLRPPREGRRNPVFQVMFSYFEGDTPVPHLTGLSVERVATPPRSAKMELTFNVALSNGTMRLELEWNAGRLDEALAGRLADDLLFAAEAVADDPSIRVRDLEMS